jgi:predicted DNA-binding transcriptional regulator AlpA
LRRPAAAHYVGVSATKFDEWVAQGLMPQPKQQGSVVVWDRLDLDAAFDVLPDRPTTTKFNPYAD